jgi:vacuolar iron transporter family protein
MSEPQPPRSPGVVHDWRGFARHYVRDIVYAANDGVVTTFAIVAGVRGAGFSAITVLALGFANLAADGLSMALGNYLGIKSEQAALQEDGYEEWRESVHAARHALVTWLAFGAAGMVPLLPFLLPVPAGGVFLASLSGTLLALGAVGAARTVVTRRPWWHGALEMVVVGSLAGAAAFLAGLGVERFAR